ncbi:MAG: ParB/RepB/Spo0J family partition protein [Lachnospiraceae bacterium]|nr:ParB/RepB/Spo0J family partition protein [Lachnospiraceae bacterium]
MFGEDTEQKVLQIPIYRVEPDREQPRKHFDKEKLEELAVSIREHGIIQPIVVHKENGGYTIISGERRWRAARLAGLKQVPVLVREADEAEIAELALIENIQREDLNAMEEAEAYARLIREFGMQQSELAARLGKSRPAVSNCLRLLDLDSSVAELLRNGRISEGHARALLAVSDHTLQKKAADKVIKEKLSVRDTERFARELMSRPKKRSSSLSSSADREQRAAAIEALTDEIRQTLSVKTEIRERKRGGELVLSFADDDDLERLCELLLSIRN